jgi:uncharacterized damage-inducible protein DinB
VSDAFSYPIGKVVLQTSCSSQERQDHISTLEELPRNLRAAVVGLSAEQLETPYRDGGWTVRQVVHHLADSHMQGYMRFKLALSEDHPFMTTYNQPAWGEFKDARTAPPEISLKLLEALHVRWVLIAKAMKSQDFARTLLVKDETRTLDNALHLYAWHGLHHVAQINTLKQRKAWQ